MPGKAKFNPQVTRIKLNPEQAVLMCSCVVGETPDSSVGYRWTEDTKSVGDPPEAYTYCYIPSGKFKNKYLCKTIGDDTGGSGVWFDQAKS